MRCPLRSRPRWAATPTLFLTDVGKSLSTLGAATGNPAVPLFAVFLGGLIAAIGAFFVWVELLIRSAAIYVTVLFLPFTFVAMIWPSTAKWCRRLVELLFAVIVSKFVIVAIMALAAAGLGQSRADDAFQGVLAGTALMLLAALSPLALLRLIPLAEAAAAHIPTGGRARVADARADRRSRRDDAARRRRQLGRRGRGGCARSARRASRCRRRRVRGRGGRRWRAGDDRRVCAPARKASVEHRRGRRRDLPAPTERGTPPPAAVVRRPDRPARPRAGGGTGSRGRARELQLRLRLTRLGAAAGGSAPRGTSAAAGGGKPPIPPPRDPARDRQAGGKNGR